MKILLINKFYYHRGGSETYLFNLKRLLEEHGHEVVVFSMKDERNASSPYSEFFVNNVSYDIQQSLVSEAKKAFRSLYSFEAKRKLSELVEREKPDVAHIHNFVHQLTPSILHALRSHDVPAVLTLHDFQLISPSYLLTDSKGNFCERCRPNRYFRCVQNRCVKNSYRISLLASCETAIHRMFKTYEHNVKIFIAPSQFMRDTFRLWNFKPHIEYLPNFIPLANKSEPTLGNGVLFGGRLSAQKGLFTLLEAAQRLSDIPFIICGDGDLSTKLLNTKLHNVSVLGQLEHNAFLKELERARLVVVPSTVYENNPYIVLEAMSCGKPVIGSRLGGIPELVTHGETGLLFSAGNSRELVENIRRLYHDENRCLAFGKRAQERVENDFSQNKHYEHIIQIYERAIKT